VHFVTIPLRKCQTNLGFTLVDLFKITVLNLVVVTSPYLPEEFIQMPQSVLRCSLIFAILTYLLSGCGVSEGGSVAGKGGSVAGSSSSVAGSSSSVAGSSTGENDLGIATVSWTPPTQNTDGSNLGADLAGYRIYYGTSSRDYSNSLEIDNPGLSSFVVEGLAETTWYFVMTAVNASGIESSYSEEVSLSVAIN